MTDTTLKWECLGADDLWILRADGEPIAYVERSGGNGFLLRSTIGHHQYFTFSREARDAIDKEAHLIAKAMKP